MRSAITAMISERHHDADACENLVALLLAAADPETSDGPVRSEHISGLTLTRQVFSEAMRLYSLAAIITRMATRAFPLGGFVVPEGAVIVVPIHAVHHHAAL